MVPQAGQLSTLKELILAFNHHVNQHEPETLVYRWFFNSDNSKCFVLETFASQEAFVFHLKNVEPMLPELLAVAPITDWHIYGTLPDAVAEGLRAFGAPSGVVPQFFTYASGFVRHQEAVAQEV